MTNQPDVLAELRACHGLYEKALVENDTAVLESLFWESPHAVRFGVTENLHGFDEIVQFRRNRPNINLAREVTRLEIVAFGRDAGVVNLEFTRVIDGTPRHGRQSQFWIRQQEGWKIVSAHVSLPPSAPHYATAAAAQLHLPIDPSLAGEVRQNIDRTASLAAFLMEFPLDQQIEAAPVFYP